MSGFVQQSAITLRLEKLKAQWLQAVSDPAIKVVRWYALQDEQRMVQAFLELESSDQGTLSDIFIRLNAPFNEAASYSSALLEELMTRYREEEELVASLEEEGTAVKWSEAYQSGTRLPVPGFKELFQHLSRFLDCFPEFEGNLVLYFTPDEISHQGLWEKWLTDAVLHGLPSRVLFTVVDCHLYNYYQKLSARCGHQVKSIRPELKMYEALKQMASAGNGKDPDALFRQLFIKMAEAATKKETNKMEEYAQEAIQVAAKYRWTHLEAMVHLTLGSNYLQSGKSEKAIESYNRGLHLSESSYEDGKEESGPLVLQCFMAKASAFQVRKNVKEASVCYVAAGNFAEKLKDHYQAMEAYRLAGKALEKGNATKDEALKHYAKALELASFISPDLRTNSTFLILAEDYANLAENYYNQENYARLMEQLVAIGGRDWQNKAAKIKKELSHAGS